jgi:hypothetical protein
MITILKYHKVYKSSMEKWLDINPEMNNSKELGLQREKVPSSAESPIRTLSLFLSKLMNRLLLKNFPESLVT